MNKVSKSTIIALSVVSAAVILALNSVTIIGARERGIVHTWGKPAQEIKEPGLHGKMPFVQSVKKWAVVPEEYKVVIDIGEQGAITSDNQVIGTTIRVFYAYDETRLYDAATKFNKKTIERAINALTVSATKAIIGTYTIFDVAVKQDTIVRQLESRLKTNVGQYPINVTQVTLENFDWSENFDAQIRATMEAAQNVRKAEQEANIAEQQNRKLKIEAEAKASALVAEAEGKLKAAQLSAQAEIEIAKGKNEANRLLNQNLNVEIKIRELDIAKISAERWDGRKVPNVLPMTPAGTIVQLGEK